MPNHSDLPDRGEYPHYKLDEHVRGAVKTHGEIDTHLGTYHPPFTTSVTYLSGNVTLTNANQFYDVLSVTLQPGTYLVLAGITFRSPINTSMRATAKLYEGSNVYGSMSASAAAVAGLGMTAPAAIQAIVTPSAETTYYLSGATDAAGSLALAAGYPNAAGNTATYIKVVRIG